jgi:hypothetical protein
MAQSYANGGGSGNRIGGIDMVLTGSFHIGAGNTTEGKYEFIDGLQTNGQFWFNGGTGYELVFDFREARVIDEAKWYQDNATSHGVWQWRGWNGSSWVNIGSTFTLGGSATQTQTTLNGNVTAYTKYSLLQISGSASNSPFLREIEFQIDTPPSQSYFNTGGQGVRTGGVVTVTTTATMGGGTSITALVNGSAFLNGTSACFWNSGQSAIQVKFDFGSTGHKITEIKQMWASVSPPTYTAQGGTWDVLGSDDDSTYWSVATGFTLGGAERSYWDLSANPYGYRYYKFVQQSGTTNNTDDYAEVAFQIGTGGAHPAGNVANKNNLIIVN